MEQPPFKLAQPRQNANPIERIDVYRPAMERCCGAGDEHTAGRRTRLADLDPHVHCSIIGTCLSTAELRRLIPRFTHLDRNHASDLEIHHAAVELSIAGGALAKTLHKALDTRYAMILKRFKAANDDAALSTLWREALDSGEVPGAYWAVMTHPHATEALRSLAFGDVHMLSHLVGAANRADIRRLVALEKEGAALQEQVAQQQARLQEMSTRHGATVQELKAQVAQLNLRLARQAVPSDAEMAVELTRLRHALEDRDQRLALHTARRAQAEQRVWQQQDATLELQASLERLQATVAAAYAELHATETALTHALDAGTDHDVLQALKGKHIVYVGGRPGSNAALVRMVASAGGELSVHDGGIEDRKGLLATVLPRAHAVVFPVDCISHDAMNTLKRVCSRHGVDYHPLRTASVASFIELVSRLAAGESGPRSTAPASHFCLRHG